MNELYCPPELAKDIEIIQGSHVRMCPGMNAYIMRTTEGSEELLRIIDDVDTNHKMRRCLVIRVKKLNKLSSRRQRAIIK